MKVRPVPPGRKVYDWVPEGWDVPKNQLTFPTGCRWMTNGKSRFGGEFRHELVREEVALEWLGIER